MPVRREGEKKGKKGNRMKNKNSTLIQIGDAAFSRPKKGAKLNRIKLN